MRLLLPGVVGLTGGDLCRLAHGDGRELLRKRFAGMMKAVWEQGGATLSIGIVTDERVQEFIDAHSDVLNSSFVDTRMSGKMRERLERSTWIFSGMKAIREMGEAFPSLVDEHGDRKPFERFLNDVRRVDETYNEHYLKAEYEFAASSAQMAAKWEGFVADGDRYNLQYRTAGDDRVRPEHAALDGVTLPVSDPFWDSYYPPNGWRCRCDVVQVRKSKYPETPHEEAMSLGEAATGGVSGLHFRFNPGKQERVFPAVNGYTSSKCSGCEYGGGGGTLLQHGGQGDGSLCRGCRLLRECYESGHKDARISEDDAQRILSKPIEEQYEIKYNGEKGTVLQHDMVCATREDYNRVLAVAKAFADTFGDCKINPEVFISNPAGRSTIYPDLPPDCRANPDLSTKFGYIDVKSPKKSMNCCKNANIASRDQLSCVCLTNHLMRITEKQIEDRNKAIWNSPDYHHDYIFWFIDGVLRKYDRPTP